MKALRSTIKKMLSQVAPGPSLLTNDHFKQLFPRDAADADVEPLLTVVNMALAGAIGEGAADYLAASSLTALIKKDENGVIKLTDDLKPSLRPLAMPETLNRLVGLCALITLQPEITNILLKVQQVGVGVPGACEAIAEAVRRGSSRTPYSRDTDTARLN